MVPHSHRVCSNIHPLLDIDWQLKNHMMYNYKMYNLHIVPFTDFDKYLKTKINVVIFFIFFLFHWRLRILNYLFAIVTDQLTDLWCSYGGGSPPPLLDPLVLVTWNLRSCSLFSQKGNGRGRRVGV